MPRRQWCPPCEVAGVSMELFRGPAENDPRMTQGPPYPLRPTLLACPHSEAIHRGPRMIRSRRRSPQQRCGHLDLEGHPGRHITRFSWQPQRSSTQWRVWREQLYPSSDVSHTETKDGCTHQGRPLFSATLAQDGPWHCKLPSMNFCGQMEEWSMTCGDPQSQLDQMLGPSPPLSSTDDPIR